jgi:O-methyltransferase involved in polyketide biosynthesis
MWSPVDRAKWDTWAGLDTTMTKDDAKVRYIKLVMKLDPAFTAPSLDPPVAAAKPKSSPSPSPVPIPVPISPTPPPPATESVEEEPKLREFLARSPSGLSVNTRRASANTIDDATHVVLSNSPLKKSTSNDGMVSTPPKPLTPTPTGIVATPEVKGSSMPQVDIVPEHTLANQPTHGDDYSIKLQQEADAVAYSSRQIAAARAIETNKSGRKLFIDPLARILGGEAAYEDALLRQSKADSNAAISGTDRLAIRTRFFDERVSECARHGIHQFVFMGAGMDTRAFRSPSLSLSAGKTDPVVVFELDQQSVLDIKAKLLCGVVDRYRVKRVPIGADLSNPRDWVPKLTTAGFNSSKPTAWVMEGKGNKMRFLHLAFLVTSVILTMKSNVEKHTLYCQHAGFIFYLSPDDANLLIKTVSALSSPKSYLIMSTCNKASLSNAQRGQTSLRQAWKSCLEDYQDLEESGWTNVMETQLGDPKANYGRYNGAIYPMNEPKYPRVIYVEALKELGTDKLPVSVTPRRSSVQSIFGSTFESGVDTDLQTVIREGNELIAKNAVVTKWNSYAAMYNDIINLHDIFQYMAWRLVDAVEMTEASKKVSEFFLIF